MSVGDSTSKPLDSATSRRMSQQRRSGTNPEIALRRQLWRMGLRYRIDHRILGGRRRIDIAFTQAKVAVFVDGCFWHACPEHATSPANNAGWWAEKLAANVRRDRNTDSRLEECGWTVVRVWEHESADEAAQRIERLVRGRPRPHTADPSS